MLSFLGLDISLFSKKYIKKSKRNNPKIKTDLKTNDPRIKTDNPRIKTNNSRTRTKIENLRIKTRIHNLETKVKPNAKAKKDAKTKKI